MKLVVVFLVSTFLMTYGAHGLLILFINQNTLTFESGIGQLLFILGGSAPTVMAFVMIHALGSDAHKQTFYAQLKRFKTSLKWVLFALFMPLALALMHSLFALISGIAFTDVPILPLYFVYLFPSIIFGGLEEIGWRGIVQTQCQKRFGLLFFSIAFGVLWSFWHVPMFFIDALAHSNYNFIPFLLQGIVFSMFISWLFAKTKSLPLAVLFHAGINAAASAGYTIGLRHQLPTYIFIVIAFFSAVILIISYEKMVKTVTHDV